MNEQEIFSAALDLPKDKRLEYLDKVCAENRELAQSVEKLLEMHESESEFMSVSAVVSTLDDQTTLRTGSRVGPYELKEPLGEGGMGAVFRATQNEPIEREVAIKIIKAGLDTKEVVSRFQAEQRTLALMDHPFVAKVLEAGQTEGGRPFFVMELVDGMPITEFCDANRLTIKQRLGLFIDVCKAVQHAHAKSVIHRDIKPGNILVRMVDGQPKPKVIDFGVAKALDQNSDNRDIVTKVTQVVGTPLYMSPEQADTSKSRSLDTRTDVYSLGVLLYELLTGTTPFDRERLLKVADIEVRRIIREEEPPKPSTKISTLGESATSISDSRITDWKKLQRTLQGDLDWIVMKTLEKDPDRRYETAAALADDVRRFLDSEPVLASPPSHWYQFNRFASRNRVLIAVAATMLGLLVAGVIGTSYGLVQAIKANAELEKSLGNEAQARKEAQENAELAQQKSTEAQRQVEVANAVVDFLTKDLLAVAAPQADKVSGKNVLVREALDKAAQKIELESKTGGKFADKPFVEAAIRKTIGTTYMALGLRAKGIPHLERSYELLRGHKGLPKYFANTRRELLLLLTSEFSSLGRLKEAEAFGNLLLEDRLIVYGAGHELVATAESALAKVYYHQGRLTESIELYENSLRVLEATKPPEDFALLTTQANLAFAYFGTGEHDEEAFELSMKMLPAAEKTDSDVIHADILESLGMYRAKKGEFETARENFLKAKKLRTKVYGARNEYTNSLNVALGTLASMQGDFEQAYKFQKLSHEINAENNVPVESTRQCLLRGNIAWCLINLDRFEEAGEILNQHLEKTDKALGPTHYLVTRNYGMLQTIADKLDKLDSLETAISLRGSLVNHYENLIESKSASAKDLLSLALILGNQRNKELFDRQRAVELAQSAKSLLADQEKPDAELQQQIDQALDRFSKNASQ